MKIETVVWPLNEFDAEWIHDLPDSAKIAWLQFVSYTTGMKGSQGKLPKVHIKALAQRITVDLNVLKLLLRSALANNVIVDHGDHWEIVGFERFMKPDTMRRRGNRAPLSRTTPGHDGTTPGQQEKNDNSGSKDEPLSRTTPGQETFTENQKDSPPFFPPSPQHPSPPYNPPSSKKYIPREEENLGSKPKLSAKQHESTPEVIEHLKNSWLRVFGKKKAFALRPKGVIDLDRRLHEYSVEDCKLVIDFQFESWKHKPEMHQYLKHTTLFRPTNFARYLIEAQEWEAENRPTLSQAKETRSQRGERGVFNTADIAGMGVDD